MAATVTIVLTCEACGHRASVDYNALGPMTIPSCSCGASIWRVTGNATLSPSVRENAIHRAIKHHQP